MGYSISVTDSQFFIPADQKAACFAAMKAMQGRFRWVEAHQIRDAKNIEDLFYEWGWSVENDADGNIKNIAFELEKIGDEDKLWKVIAPFVRSGSFIEVHGEDGAIWRWVWKDGAFETIEPTVSW